jgi:hypothetical protein
VTGVGTSNPTTFTSSLSNRPSGRSKKIYTLKTEAAGW